MMIPIPFVILVLGLIVACLYLALRIKNLTGQIRDLTEKEAGSAQVLSQLVARVYRLERTRAGPVIAEPPPSIESTVTESPVTESAPVLSPAPAEAVTPDAPPTREDWESVVGGNWLNKLGVLVLVVGIALFLGYGITQLGPAGKVVIGFMVGASLLGSGVLLEKRPNYLTYGRGLIAGGWAAIYFTAYAMHGVDAARVISDPFLGTALLLGVSIAILLHSFSYNSEPATGVAFFVAFVSLNLSPLTSFSVVATLVLALSLTLVAYRFGWFRLAAAGILFTYASFALRYDPAIYSHAGLLNGQAILWIYWLSFEIYDLLDLRRREGPAGPIHLTAPTLNACGFIAASLMHQTPVNATDWSRFLALGAFAYLASAEIRERLHGDARLAVTASAMLFAGSIVEGFSGLRVPMALTVEGELIFLAGVIRNRPFLKGLGSLIFVIPFVHLYAIDIPKDKLHTASPLAAVMALTFYANRFLAGGGWYFSAAASLLVATVVQLEIVTHWIAVIWAAMSVAALWLGIRRNDVGLRIQSYLLAIAVFVRMFVVNFDAEPSTRIVTTALVVACLYGSQFLLRSRNEERPAAHVLSILGTVLLTSLLFVEVQGRLLTVSWGIEGVGLLILGFWARERTFRLSGLALFLFCIAKLFLYDLRELDTLSRILSFIILGLMLLGASWIYTRFREQIRRLL